MSHESKDKYTREAVPPCYKTLESGETSSRHDIGFEPEPRCSLHIDDNMTLMIKDGLNSQTNTEAENDLQQNGGYEHPPQSDNDSFQGSSIADGDEDSLRLIAEGLESQYNYNAEGTNTAYTVFLIVNAALGAGLLNFPKSYDDAGGIVVAFMVQLILLLFIMVALIGLAYASDRCSAGKASTIQDTMEGMTGRWGRIICSTCVVIYTFGTTITFLIIIGDQFDSTFKSLYGPTFAQKWYMDRSFTTSLCACVFILPMCYSKRIDFLRIPSTLGVLAIFYLVGLSVYEYHTGSYIPGPIKTKPTKWTDVFLVVPTICFGYQCHVSVIPIYSCMKERTLKNFTIAVTTAIIICVASYTIVATYGYLTFGNKVNEDILMSYEGGGLVYAGMYAMALKIITTYPILLFCGREGIKSVVTDLVYAFGSSSNQEAGSVIDNETGTASSVLQATNINNTIVHGRRRSGFRRRGDTTTFQGPTGAPPLGTASMAGASGGGPAAWAAAAFGRGEERKELIVRYVCVTVWFFLSLVLALVIPNIGDVIKLLGSLAAVFIFIFPGLCMFKCTLRSDPSYLRKKSMALISMSLIFMALGGFIFGVVFTQGIKGLINGQE